MISTFALGPLGTDYPKAPDFAVDEYAAVVEQFSVFNKHPVEEFGFGSSAQSYNGAAHCEFIAKSKGNRTRYAACCPKCRMVTRVLQSFHEQQLARVERRPFA